MIKSFSKRLGGLVLGLVVMGLSAGALAENLNQSSYGKWLGYESEVLQISRHGIDAFFNTVTCEAKKYKPQQISAVYSGGQLISRIDDAMEIGGDERQLRLAKSLIDPNRDYDAIDVLPPPCADGGVTFVQLNANTALYIEVAPDDVFYVLKKH